MRMAAEKLESSRPQADRYALAKIGHVKLKHLHRQRAETREQQVGRRVHLHRNLRAEKPLCAACDGAP